MKHKKWKDEKNDETTEKYMAHKLCCLKSTTEEEEEEESMRKWNHHKNHLKNGMKWERERERNKRWYGTWNAFIIKKTT